jgi:hypothetical protein
MGPDLLWASWKEKTTPSPAKNRITVFGLSACRRFYSFSMYCLVEQFEDADVMYHREFYLQLTPFKLSLYRIWIFHKDCNVNKILWEHFPSSSVGITLTAVS